jgi:glutathione synthase/RimK-type ligase-like ATP-grasp enzyme
MTVLVLTCPEDVTADMVVDRLNRDAVPVLRLDPAGFPGRVELVTTISPGCVNGWIRDGLRTVALSDISSIWVRRPGAPHSFSELQPEWSAHEATHALYGTLRSLPGVRWVNHPDAQAAARFKLPQLLAAHRVGLRTPQTLVTTTAKAAASFAHDQGRAALKTISGRQPDGLALPTTFLTAETDFSAVNGSPTCLQRIIDKIADVRLTVVGDTMFCAVAECGEEDVRFTKEVVSWRQAPVPDGLRDQVSALMAAYGLAYAALDFAIDQWGTWWFLEANPAGQFGFIELATQQPIAQAVASYLAAPNTAPIRA